MDFKSIISKLDSMDAPTKTPSAPVLPQAMQLNEDAQLRVLSGRSTYVAEAKKKAEEEIEEAAEKTATTWTDKSGKKHPATSVKGDKYQGKEAEAEEKKAKKKDESIEPAFKSKFMKMVEAKKSGKKKPDDDNDGVPDWADEKPGEDDNAGKKKGAKPKKGVNPFAKKESVEEAAEKTPKSWTDKSGKKHPGMAVKGDKYQGKEAEAEEKKKTKKDESVARSKKVVAESIEQKLSFKEMLQMVQESGGQQQIDPVDAELFAWASRVAKQKLGENMKAQVYAGMVYERMGGVFEMYDVLSEDQK